jgi:hypothetical protein
MMPIIPEDNSAIENNYNVSINFFNSGQALCICAPYISMKTYKSKPVAILAFACILTVLQLTGCSDRFPSSYVLELPGVPEPWVSLLGEPFWRVEWVDSNGRKQTADIQPGGGLQTSIKIELPVTWASPVTAWPYWPGHNLTAGFFKPAGAMFPYDANGSRLRLSWEAGVDTIFYRELAYANEDNHSRIPANFDWPRFRELFEAETTNEAIREDPWLVNWRSVAERTVAGTFDRRRLVPEASIPLPIPVPSGPWYGTSPFAKPLFFKEGEPSIFPIRPGINIWVSAEGILRVNGNIWVFEERRK